MVQDLYAFWEYNTYPYTLGAEVVEFLEDGHITAKGFGGLNSNLF